MHLDLIQVYAKSQLDFPEGIGLKHSLFIKNWVVGNKELYECTRKELIELINKLRDEYKFTRECKKGKT